MPSHAIYIPINLVLLFDTFLFHCFGKSGSMSCQRSGIYLFSSSTFHFQSFASTPVFRATTTMLPGQSMDASHHVELGKEEEAAANAVSTCCSTREQRSLSSRLTSRACSLVKEATHPTDAPNNQN